jgi:hypothetical protein
MLHIGVRKAAHNAKTAAYAANAVQLRKIAAPDDFGAAILLVSLP